MKISILLPYKENFSPIYPGAVSLFVKDTASLSKYKKNIIVFGNTNYKKIFPIKYYNIHLSSFKFQSKSKQYVDKFIEFEKKNPSDLIEVHNRPNYLFDIIKSIATKNLVLYFVGDTRYAPPRLSPPSPMLGVTNTFLKILVSLIL